MLTVQETFNYAEVFKWSIVAELGELYYWIKMVTLKQMSIWCLQWGANFGGDHFWQLLVTISSGDVDAININTKGSPVIDIIIELSNGVYSEVPILGGTIFGGSWLLLVVVIWML